MLVLVRPLKLLEFVPNDLLELGSIRHDLDMHDRWSYWGRGGSGGLQECEDR